jgi:hypothetical protein
VAKLAVASLGKGSYWRRVHDLVALVTAVCFGVAILPWTMLLLSRSPPSFAAGGRTILDSLRPPHTTDRR